METMQEVKWGDRIVKSGIAEIITDNKPLRTDFNCNITRKFENMGMHHQAELQRQWNRKDYVENFGFRRLDIAVLYRITEYYIKMYIRSFSNADDAYCSWDSDIFQTTWTVEGIHNNSGWMKYTLSSPWRLMEHQEELMPILIAESLYNKRALFDMILVSSTAHITTIRKERMFYASPVAIGKVGINSYLLAYWGDYPKFLEHPGFKQPVLEKTKDSELVKTEFGLAYHPLKRKRIRSLADLIFMNREEE